MTATPTIRRLLSRMNTATLLFAIITSLGFAGGEVKRLANKDISNADRDALVEKLKRSEPSESAPPILKLMRACSSVGATEPGMGPKPWMNNYHSHQAKAWYASIAVWHALFRGKDDTAKVAILLQLLNDHHDSYSRRVVLKKLSSSHWNSDAEREVFSLLQDKETPDATKGDALQALMKRTGEKYVPHAITFIQSAPNKDNRRWDQLFNVGNQFFRYSRKNQNEIIAIGFAILEANATPGTSNGYHLARQLGYFLKIPRTFAPDQESPQYQGRSGLNEKFFADTVKNALEWRKENPTVVRSMP